MFAVLAGMGYILDVLGDAKLPGVTCRSVPLTKLLLPALPCHARLLGVRGGEDVVGGGDEDTGPLLGSEMSATHPGELRGGCPPPSPSSSSSSPLCSIGGAIGI